MPTLPNEFLTVILPYATLFCKRVFDHVQLLLTGAILTPGKRTITSVLRIMGEGSTKTFHKYHRVLSQVAWSTLQASRLLLNQLVSVFIGLGPIVVGIDETIERRWGAQIKARGIYRDAVRSTHKQVVKCSGLRWVSVMRGRPCGFMLGSLGRAGLGTALFDGFSTLRSVLQRQGPCSQDAHRLGQTVAAGG